MVTITTLMCQPDLLAPHSETTTTHRATPEATITRATRTPVMQALAFGKR